MNLCLTDHCNRSVDSDSLGVYTLQYSVAQNSKSATNWQQHVILRSASEIIPSRLL